MRVLFVDDETSLVALGRILIAHLGYEAVCFTDPTKALECAKSEQFDFVITDLTMPGMTGLELGKALHEIHPGLPIILSTAYYALLEGKSAQALGFQGYLAKPYGLREFADAIHDALQIGAAMNNL
jgi:CheY-like chemotaxis protein